MFDSAFASFAEEQKTTMVYPFKVMVIVPTEMSPRNEYFEFYLDNSRGFVERVVYGAGVLASHELAVLPERWMNPKEQREFMQKICEHPTVGNLQELKLVTQCPVILTDFLNTSIKVVQGFAGREPRPSGRRGLAGTIGSIGGMQIS